MPIKSSISKRTVAILASIIIISMAIGATVAYIVKRSEPSKNTFVPVYVDSEPKSTETGISVKNAGDITAYLRASVVVNWAEVDANGNATGHYYSLAPAEGVDYSISYDRKGAWMYGSDGFWYHKTPVGAGATAEDLILDIVRLSTPPEGYMLSVEVLTLGIQAAPTEVVAQAWGVTVDGILITK